MSGSDPSPAGDGSSGAAGSPDRAAGGLFRDEVGPVAWARRALGALLGAAAALGAFVLLARPASLSCGAGRMVDLELAGSGARATQAVAGCTAGQVRDALTADLPLIGYYAAVLAASAYYLGRSCYRVKVLRGAAGRVAAAAVAGALLDLIEDAALLAGVGRTPSSGLPAVTGDVWPTVAAVCAWSKFLVLGAVVGYVAGALAGFVATPAPLRRLLMKPPQALPPEPGPAGRARRYAICLSGGGVRSASFGLGGLQGLERPAGSPLRWSAAERVAAVSGGSYMAGAWAVARIPQDGGDPGHGTALQEPLPWAAGSPEERAFAMRLGYLLAAEPRGSKLRTAPVPAIPDGSTPGRAPGPESHQEADAPNPPGKDAPGVIVTLTAGAAVNIGVLVGLLWLVSRPLGWLVGSCPVQPSLQYPLAKAGAATGPGCPPGWRVPSGRFLDLPEPVVRPAVVLAALTGLAAVLWVLSGRVRQVPVVAPVARVLHRRARPVVMTLAALTVALALLLVVLPAALVAIPRSASSLTHGQGLGAPPWVSAVVAALSWLGGIAAVKRVLSTPLAALAPRAGGVVLLLGALLLGLLWAAGAAVGGTGDDRGHYLIWAGVWAVGYAVLCPEWWSMAPFYRGRLRGAYATYRDPGNGLVTSYGDGDRPALALPEPSLYRFAAAAGTPGYPELVVATTMTVSDRSVLTHYGIPAYRVMFTPGRCTVCIPRTDDGVYVEQSCSTQQLEALTHRWDSSRLTTMLAVAASGAAASPAMGRLSFGSTDALLAFANVRLGVWLPNPAYVAALGGQGLIPAHPGTGRSRWLPYPRVRLSYLLKELLGLHDPSDLYVYLTDGGHWENTGLVDVLRNGVPDEIVCLDGSGVPTDRLTSVAEAIGLARLECATVVDLDLDALRADPALPRGHDYARRCVGLGTVIRHRDDGSVEAGLLWYAKPVLTAASPAGALAYRERVPTFPATTTLDQFFDTEIFEAYRDLGRDAAAQIVAARERVAAVVLESPSYLEFGQRAAADGEHWAVAELAHLLSTHDDAAAIYQILHTRLTPPPGDHARLP